MVGRGLLAERLGQLARRSPRSPRACPRRRSPAARRRAAAPRRSARASRAAPGGRRANEMFGRSKPVATCSGSLQPEPPRRCRPRPAAWPWRSRRRSPARRGGARRRRGGSSRAGSRAPTATRSAPRRPRTARRCAACIRSSEPGRGEPLGRHVEQAQLAGRRARAATAAFGVDVLLGVDQRDPVAEPARVRAPRPGPASAPRAATRRSSGRRAAAPAAGSRATCPSRSA